MCLLKDFATPGLDIYTWAEMMLYVPAKNDFAKRFNIVIRKRDAFPFPPTPLIHWTMNIERLTFMILSTSWFFFSPTIQ